MQFAKRLLDLRARSASVFRTAGALALCACALFAGTPAARAQQQPQQQQQPQDVEMQTIIDDDLEAQANAAIDAGHQDEALALLDELVKRDPRRAGALLESALLRCRMGERDVVHQTLARIESNYTVPPTIEKLIQFYKNSVCTPEGKKPQLIVSVRAGVTSNANFGPTDPNVTFADGESLPLLPSALAHSDQFVESSVQGELPVRAISGLTLFGGVTQRQYRDLHDFDQRIASAGVSHELDLARGSLENEASADLFWLGTKLYQSDIAWRTGYWSPPAALHSSIARTGVDFTVTDTTYPGNSLYDGVRLELRAAVQARFGAHTSMLMFVGPVWELPSGNRPGASRHGYSAWLALDYDLGRYGQIEAVLQRRTLMDSAPYAPEFFGNTIQTQTLQTASLEYAYPVNRSWSLFTRFSAQRISDQIQPFAYSVREGSVGLSWKY